MPEAPINLNLGWLTILTYHSVDDTVLIRATVQTECSTKGQ